MRTSLQLIFVLCVAAKGFAETGNLGRDAAPISPAEHQARFNYTRVQPLFETPMRDCAITRGPDGFFSSPGRPEPLGKTVRSISR